MENSRLGEERRRKQDLTPMSGELNAPADWVPPGPVAAEHRIKKEKPLPRTRRQVVLAGIRRIVIILALLVGLIALVGLLLVEFKGMKPARAFPLAFYLGGALIAAGGVLGATTGPMYGMPVAGISRSEHEHAVNWSFVYGFFGVTLIAVGVLLDSVL
jgi:hypothetical protein